MSLDIQIVSTITEIHGKLEHCFNRSLDYSIIGRRKDMQIHNHNFHVFFNKNLGIGIFVEVSDLKLMICQTNEPSDYLSGCQIIARTLTTTINLLHLRRACSSGPIMRRIVCESWCHLHFYWQPHYNCYCYTCIHF
jgi:hypothetical protein